MRPWGKCARSSTVRGKNRRTRSPRPAVEARPGDSASESLDPAGDPLRGLLPGPLLRHLAGGGGAAAGSLLAVLEDVAQERAQVLGVRVRPAESLVVGAL